MIRKLFAFVGWLSVQGNRRRVYKGARFVIPLLVAGGFLAPGDAAHVLAILAAVAGFAVPHLAARHSRGI